MHPSHPALLQPDRIAPIVDPDMPPWMRTMAPGFGGGNEVARGLAIAGGVMAPFGIGAGLFFVSPILGILVLLLATIGIPVGAFVFTYRLAPHVVSAPKYAYRGVPIEGKALDLLADIQHRFAWAEKMFAEVPTGIRWAEVEHQVDVLLWEAAGHAAKVSAIDAELANLVYAAEASPQGGLRRELQRKRSALWAALEATQREADDLAREASNAAAAARIALSRTGSVFDLEVVTPTGADLVARGTLAVARARLALLTEVWSELDETGAIADARFAGELPPPTTEP